MDWMALSLDGLATGDGFGEKFFVSRETILRRIEGRVLPQPVWRYTDDTEMALSICEILQRHGRIDQDALARAFAKRMDYSRGYGKGAYELLTAIQAGEPWRAKSAALFGGQGSFGNGAAMRVAPLGAYFHDDLARVRDEARLSAEVTHAHREGIAGAIAVAVAAALAVRHRTGRRITRDAFLRATLAETPPGEVHDGIDAALRLDAGAGIVDAAKLLGNGSGVSAPDTVPICLFVAARNLDSYEDALWDIVAALGDRDTTCAITGGIVALSSGGVPETWRSARELLPM